METVIDLGELTKGRVRMLSGHDRGSEARRHFNIRELEAQGDTIVIMVPKDLDAITPSFIQGMFAKSETLPDGRAGFLKRYKISAPDFIIEDVLAGIDRLIMRRSLSSGE